jgi:hypothetical protein
MRSKPALDGDHAGREREVSSRRLSGDDDPIDVERVVLRVIDDPAQRAAAVFDRCGCERHRREAVLDVHH